MPLPATWRNLVRRTVAAVVAVLITATAFVPATAHATTLTDISGHWARLQIEQLVDLGIIKGYENGSFLPDSRVTRAEFVTMLNRAAGLSVIEYTGTFRDVEPNDWFAEQVAAAVKDGYIKGDGTGLFAPERVISRNEVAVALARALCLPPGSTKTQFTDAATTPAWASPSISAVADAGYIKGYDDGSFSGSRSLTRAEAATLISRVRERLLMTRVPADVRLSVVPGRTVGMNIDSPIVFRLENSGGTTTEAVTIELTITAASGTIDPYSVSAGYQPEGSPSYYADQVKPMAGQSGAVTVRIGKDGGYVIPWHGTVTIPTVFSFKSLGHYGFSAQAVGATSGALVGEPVSFDQEVSPIVASIVGNGNHVPGAPIELGMGMIRDGQASLGELLAPTLTISRADGGVIAADDMILETKVSQIPTDTYQPLTTTLNADGTSLEAQLLPRADLNPPAWQLSTHARLTIFRPGQYVFTWQAVGTDSGSAIGMAGVMEYRVDEVWPFAGPSVTLPNGMGYLVDQTTGCPFWIRYHLESGLADERTIVRLQFTKTNIADDDIILGAVSQPVPLTRVSADTLEVYWTPSIDRLYSGIDRSHSVIMTAKAGQYAVKAELIGLDTGRVYSEYSRALPVSLITVTTHGSGPAVVGQAVDYTLTYHNARNEAVPEPFVATMLIDQFIGTPLSLTPEALVVKYQDPTDQLWKPATLARNAAGVIEARFGEYSLAAGADLTIPFQVTFGGSWDIRLGGTATGVSGRWYGNSQGSDWLNVFPVPAPSGGTP